MEIHIFIFIFLLFSYSESKLPFVNMFLAKEDNNSTRKVTYIYGHLNPDTDTIAASIVLADLKARLEKDENNELIPCRLGELNKETAWVLKYFGVEAPKLIKDLKGADEVILVDHNSPSQSLDFDNANIVGLYDHHAITGFKTVNPITILTKPVGSTCTILYEKYKEKEIYYSKEIAGLILSAIISDTLLLESSTTTQADREAVQYLAGYVGVNYKDYGRQMLAAGANVTDLTDYELINYDSKAYTVNGYKIQIANINTAEFSDILRRKEGLIEEIDKFIKEKNKELFVLVVVHIFDMDSKIISRGNLYDIVEKAFNVKLEDYEAFLKGITSRKKDVYPRIAEQINLLPSKPENNENSENSGNRINYNYILTALYLCIYMLI